MHDGNWRGCSEYATSEYIIGNWFTAVELHSIDIKIIANTKSINHVNNVKSIKSIKSFKSTKNVTFFARATCTFFARATKEAR